MQYVILLKQFVRQVANVLSLVTVTAIDAAHRAAERTKYREQAVPG